MDRLADQTNPAHVNGWASILGERRANPRFPFVQDLVFERKGSEGDILPLHGKTLNMSSSGILFETDSSLAPGEVLQMAIHWPAQLDQRCAMKIVVVGKVVRSSKGQAAIEILRHVFKTVGKNGLRL